MSVQSLGVMGNIANTRFWQKIISHWIVSQLSLLSLCYNCNPAVGPTTTQSRRLWQYVTVDSSEILIKIKNMVAAARNTDYCGKPILH